jgi:hypothetical protein
VGRQRGYLASAAWGLTWRYAVLAGAVVADEYRVNASSLLVAEFAGILALGVVIGLWHRRSRLAALWRALTLAVLVAYLGPAWPGIYPYALVLALALATTEPWIAATRRRRTVSTPAGVVPADERQSPTTWWPPIPAPAAGAPPAWTAARSADGRFLWDGRRWLPASASVPRRRKSPRLLRAGVVLAAVATGAYAVTQNPGVISRSAQAVEQAVAWVHDTVAAHPGSSAPAGGTTAALGNGDLS